MWLKVKSPSTFHFVFCLYKGFQKVVEGGRKMDLFDQKRSWKSFRSNCFRTNTHFLAGAVVEELY